MGLEWVFGYGSLIWNPGFAYTNATWGVLHGWQRACCRYSFRHRGTPQKPGLVVGLREGGTCKGVAYAILPSEIGKTFAYLDSREGDGYLRQKLPIAFPKGHSPRFIEAWVYVPNPQHPSYFGGMNLEHIAPLVAHGLGESGESYVYVKTLLEHLRQQGIHEDELEYVLAKAALLREPRKSSHALPHVLT